MGYDEGPREGGDQRETYWSTGECMCVNEWRYEDIGLVSHMDKDAREGMKVRGWINRQTERFESSGYEGEKLMSSHKECV